MNERIRELAEQYKDEIRDGFDGWEVIRWGNVEDLIHDVVRECIGIVGHGGEFASRPKLVEKLQEHFGVES